MFGGGAASLANKPADFRVLEGTNVAYCGTSQISFTGTFQFSVTLDYPFVGPLSEELVLNTDMDPSFGPSDFHYAFVNCSSTISFQFGSRPQSPITWTLGVACPGN